MISVSDFLKKDLLKLPKKQNNSNFREFLFGLLDQFEADIQDISLDDVVFDPKTDLTLVKNLIDGIKQSIDQYLNGYPARAYEVLKEALERNQIVHFISRGDLQPGTSFYRLRTHDQHYPLDQKELFHIPFNKRGRVSTQRFSIPGFPCLYMSNAVYVAWEELGRKPIDEIHVARLVNIETLKCLDLTTDVYTGKDTYLSNKAEPDKWNYIKAWPLIAACSVKVFDKKDSFKPEYIIPQLLLQFIRSDESALSGIKFSSTHINQNEYEFNGEFYNYAIPVKSESDDGYCAYLRSVLEMTDVVPWDSIQKSV